MILLYTHNKLSIIIICTECSNRGYHTRGSTLNTLQFSYVDLECEPNLEEFHSLQNFYRIYYN